jgi:lipoate-protein ligase A
MTSLTTCRLLPHAVADGPHNMAADATLLESAAAGIASVRFYGWSEATVSLGYFQPERLRQSNPRTADLPFVRRPTGGAALVHHHELTYALALPDGDACWLCRMHQIIAAALRGLGVSAFSCQAEVKPAAPGLLCFQHHTPGDLLIDAAKVVGSAQRRQRRALLQHGGILLATSPYTPELPGIRELSGRSVDAEQLQQATLRELADQGGLKVEPGAWNDKEQRRIAALVETRYGQSAWNRKR